MSERPEEALKWLVEAGCQSNEKGYWQSLVLYNYIKVLEASLAEAKADSERLVEACQKFEADGDKYCLDSKRLDKLERFTCPQMVEFVKEWFGTLGQARKAIDKLEDPPLWPSEQSVNRKQ